MKSVWSDWRPPSPIDREAFLFMGCLPWTPDQENKQPRSPDAASGACVLCGGDEGLPIVQSVLDSDGYPVVISEVPPGSHRVCARCMRSGKDQYSRGVDQFNPPAIEEGYVTTMGGAKVPERFNRLVNGRKRKQSGFVAH